MIQALLNQYIPEVNIPLHHTSPYTLLIAVLLSAQCRDERVNTVTAKLFKKADTPQTMIRLSIDEILSIIRPCGLGPTKAKAIYELSKILIQDYEGQVPNTLEKLETLPGVGHKTASVVLCQAFKIPAFPVDTHILRAARRWKISDKKAIEKVELDLKHFFDKKDWIKVHLQIILYCRKYCPARGHIQDKCPICHHLSKESP